jgi:hypothetical protein
MSGGGGAARPVPVAVIAMANQMCTHEAPAVEAWWPIRMVKSDWLRPTAVNVFVVRCASGDEPYLVHLTLN